MQLISRLEQAASLDPVVSAGQRVVGLIRSAKVRDALHGVWLGHPLHPVLVQAAAGAWLSASVMDLAGDPEAARLLAAAGLAMGSWWTDSGGQFGLSLSYPASEPAGD